MAWRLSVLGPDLDRYLAFKRALGFKYRIEASLLRNFVRHAESQGDTLIEADCVVGWAALAPSPRQRRDRLLTARSFAVFLQAEDGRHEAPPAGAMAASLPVRRLARLYTEAEIVRLMEACRSLRSSDFPLRPRMYAALFGLIASTGLRVSEALALWTTDLTSDGLLIRETKFRKSRLVPLHPTTRAAMADYLAARAVLPGRMLFVARSGDRLPYQTVINTFLSLARTAGLRGPPGEPGRRIHDLRHTFAVRSLEECAGTSAAVSRHMHALSTYLGHVHVSHTYHYLQAAPALLRQISDAAESMMEHPR